jgi:PPIC-type PPIASE domain
MRATPAHPSKRLAATLATLAAAALALASCGGAGHAPFVARVGSSTITQQALLRSIRALAPEHIAPEPPSYSACVKHQQELGLAQTGGSTLKEECRQQYRALERQALALAISWQWLLGQAAARHLQISSAEVQARLREDGGTSATAQGGGGQEQLLARAELAAAKLRQGVIDAQPPVTHAQLLDYYRRHLHHFERPELRYIELAENYPTVAAAEKARREVLAGVKLAGISLHEKLEGTYIPNGSFTKKAARKAIFAAKPHVLSQPVLLNAAYSFFEITRIVPAHLKPFAQVERSLRARLEGERRKRALARAISAWRREWTARTDCAPGYVIQKCRQYRGAKAPESQLAFN